MLIFYRLAFSRSLYNFLTFSGGTMEDYGKTNACSAIGEAQFNELASTFRVQILICEIDETVNLIVFLFHKETFIRFLLFIHYLFLGLYC